MTFTMRADTTPTGQRNFAQVSVEPAIDYSNGNTIYLLTPVKVPTPSKSSPKAAAPLYLVLYPTTSTIPASALNCQPNNCDHANVLPATAGYETLPGTATACKDFNGGEPCSVVEGHDHLVGVASTGGDFNVAWAVEFVVFTPKGFAAGKINTRITTLDQLMDLRNNGYVSIMNVGFTFNCSETSVQTYDKGTPVAIPFP